MTIVTDKFRRVLMDRQTSSSLFSLRIPAEENLSARQVLIRLAAHRDQRIKIRGRFDGGWALWISPQGQENLEITTVISLHPLFEEAFEQIALQALERSIFPMSHCYVRLENKKED